MGYYLGWHFARDTAETDDGLTELTTNCCRFRFFFHPARRHRHTSSSSSLSDFTLGSINENLPTVDEFATLRLCSGTPRKAVTVAPALPAKSTSPVVKPPATKARSIVAAPNMPMRSAPTTSCRRGASSLFAHASNQSARDACSPRLDSASSDAHWALARSRRRGSGCPMGLMRA